MFFFRRKKLLEIENKIDLLMEQLVVTNQKQEEMLVIFSKLENRLDTVEKQMTNNQENIANCVKETEASVKQEITNWQNENLVTQRESMNQSYERLLRMITDDGILSRDKVNAVACELDRKLDMLDSELRLLLLNSVMDQIEE